MKLLRKYVKVFDLEEGQILVQKSFDNEDDTGKHTITVSGLSIVNEVYLTLSCCFGYNDEKKRDESFDDFNKQDASDIIQMFKEEFENKQSKL